MTLTWIKEQQAPTHICKMSGYLKSVPYWEVGGWDGGKAPS